MSGVGVRVLGLGIWGSGFRARVLSVGFCGSGFGGRVMLLTCHVIEQRHLIAQSEALKVYSGTSYIRMFNEMN